MTKKTPIKKSQDKAKAFFGKASLLTGTELVDFQFPESYIDIGLIAAIEYESDKFDGKKRLYRHDVTKQRRIMMSTDGSTIIVWPPFKLTKRGIEG